MRPRMTRARDLLLVVLAVGLTACGGATVTEGADTTRRPEEPTEQSHDTGPPGARLASDVVPTRYILNLAVDPRGERFTGVIEIDVRLPHRRQDIYLHGRGLHVAEVSVADAGRDPTPAEWSMVEGREEEGLAHVRAARPVGPGTVRLRVTYSAPFDQQLEGFYRVEHAGHHYVYSQMEPLGARRAFPCFDEPSFKTPFDVTLVVREDDRAIANAREVDSASISGNMRRVRFATTEPIPTYLFALAVGPFDVVDGPPIPPTDSRSAPLALRGVAPAGEGAQLAYAMEHTGAIVRALEDYFGVGYPYDKLDLIAVPDFGAGAMENPGAITFRSRLLLLAEDAPLAQRRAYAFVTAHELAHHWFGDLVTMAWWDDLWLNEGFATWMANRPLAAWKPEWHIDVDEAVETQTALELDSLLSTRAVQSTVETSTDIDSLFDPIAYEKGASILRMVEGFIGADAFRTGVNAYLTRFAYGNATSRDFWTVLAESSVQPVDAILASFITQPGAPVVRVRYHCGPDGLERSLTQQRFVIAPTPPRATSWSIPVCLKDAQLGTRECAILPRDNGRTFRIDGGPDYQCPAPWAFVNAGATGYYRTEYPPELLAAMTPRVQSTLTAPERVSLLGDEWAMVRARRHDIGTYLTLLEGFALETSSTVVAEIAARLETIRTSLTTAETRPRLDAFARRVFEPLAETLGPNTVTGEDPERTTLRARVLQIVAAAGGQGAMLEYVRRAVDDALAGRRPLDPSTADSLVQFAARRGDAALFDRLLDASQAATSPEERDRYLNALTAFSDPALVERALALTLTPDVRTQDTPRFLARLLASPETNTAAWRFLKMHWSELAPKALNFLGGANIGAALGSFCDAAVRDDIRTFFSTHPLPGGERALAQSMERINGCLALKDAQRDALTRWLTR